MRGGALIGAALLAAACQTVPFTGRQRVMLVSADDERALGAQAYGESLKQSRVVASGPQAELVERVGRRLAAAADKPDFQWEFKLLEDDKTINAWCLPGGKVAVYTGLLPVAQDEAGLAVVMGHEIAHALARHGGERMSQGLLAQLGGTALAAAMSEKPAETQRLVMQAYGAGVGVGVLLPYSRAHESEADRIGLTLMAKAGYDPRNAIPFWERMGKATGSAGEPGIGKYLSTHPIGDDRIRGLEKWLPEARRRYRPK